jgi:hypothetical protein
MVSRALDEWEVDRKAEIRLARELAVKHLPSYLRSQRRTSSSPATSACASQSSRRSVPLSTAKRWSPFGRFSTAR